MAKAEAGEVLTRVTQRLWNTSAHSAIHGAWLAEK
jgi:hypothetical protein